jgi:hypothetical protein
MVLLLAINTYAWLVVTGIVVAIAAVLFLIDRAFAWLERNGAKTMHNDKAGGGGMAGVLGAFEEFVHPEKRYVQEERDQRKAETGQTDPSDR